MARNVQVNRIRPVFAGMDEGMHTLPDGYVAFRKSLARLTAAQQQVSAEWTATDPNAIQSRLTNDLPVLARESDLPSGWEDDLVEATRLRQRIEIKHVTLLDAVSKAESNLVRATDDYADEIIVEHLRPVLDDVIAKVRKATDGRTDLPWEQPRLLARMDKATRDAFASVEDQYARYAAIRRTQHALNTITADVDEEAWSLFNFIRNLPALWPSYAYRSAANNPPWPTDQNAMLVWSCQPDVDLWLPTSVEINDRYAQHRGGANAIRPRMADTPVTLGMGSVS